MSDGSVLEIVASGVEGEKRVNGALGGKAVHQWAQLVEARGVVVILGSRGAGRFEG